MTIKELIAELEKWPADAEVMLHWGAGQLVPIRAVFGAAGARSDSRDSAVLIEGERIKLGGWKR
jgi:hypothetical protein